MKRRRLQGPKIGSIHIRRAANGYIVDLPEQYDEFPDYGQSDEFRDKILDINFWRELATMFLQVKNGTFTPEEQSPAEDPVAPPEDQFIAPVVPENNIHVFSTWQDASDFVKNYYEN